MASNQLTEAQSNFWYAYLNWCVPFDLPPEEHWRWARELSNHAFKAGARWATKQESELSPYIARFIEMMILLGYIDDNAPLFAANEATQTPGYQDEAPY